MQQKMQKSVKEWPLTCQDVCTHKLLSAPILHGGPGVIIIHAHVAPGTIIHSDQWAAYNQVSSLPFNVGSHSTENHFMTFVEIPQPTHRTLNLTGQELSVSLKG